MVSRSSKETDVQPHRAPVPDNSNMNISEDIFASSDEDDFAAALDIAEKGEQQKEKPPPTVVNGVKKVPALKQRTLLEMLDECYTKDNESPSKKRCVVQKSNGNLDT